MAPQDEDKALEKLLHKHAVLHTFRSMPLDCKIPFAGHICSQHKEQCEGGGFGVQGLRFR